MGKFPSMLIKNRISIVQVALLLAASFSFLRISFSNTHWLVYSTISSSVIFLVLLTSVFYKSRIRWYLFTISLVVLILNISTIIKVLSCPDGSKVCWLILDSINIDIQMTPNL